MLVLHIVLSILIALLPMAIIIHMQRIDTKLF